MTKMNSENHAASLPAQTRPPAPTQTIDWFYTQEFDQLADDLLWKLGEKCYDNNGELYDTPTGRALIRVFGQNAVRLKGIPNETKL